MHTVNYVAPDALRANPRNARTHSSKQICEIADSICAFGFTVPVLIDESSVILAGHGRLEAAKLLGLNRIPAITISGLSEAQKRALLIADNKIAENADWDRDRLAIELPELVELLIAENLDISITGFETVEIEQLVSDCQENTADPADSIPSNRLFSAPVSQPGDTWQLGRHRLLCGNAREVENLNRLLGDEQAAMAFFSPPFNEFLTETLGIAATHSRAGAMHYICVDWRNLGQLLEAGQETYCEMLSLAVWVKSNAGEGSFYRSQHELIGVYRVGEGSHPNNDELRRHGRSRSNVWHYAGVNNVRAGQMDELSVYPTAKPIALVADAIKDCTRRQEIVLDTFCGSGATLLAAERVGRRAYGLELEPSFLDVAIRRWQALTQCDAVHGQTGQTFNERASNDLAAPQSQKR